MKRKKIIGTMAAILILLIVGAVAVVLVRRPLPGIKKYTKVLKQRM